MSKTYNQLPQVAFSILLALSLKERHGYEILQQIEDDSNGKLKLGPGVLYTSIKQLLGNGLITEVQQSHDTRRRYYKLSEAGMQALSAELSYYQNAVALAKQRHVLHNRAYNV